MKRITIFLIYLILSSYLNVGFVGFTPVSAQGNVVFQDDFNDNKLDTTKWTEDMAGSENTYAEENGEAHFTTYGHRTGSYVSEHAFLKSRDILISDWSSVTFSGRWKILNPGTAEMWFRVYDIDTGKYFGVRYVTWPHEITYDCPEDTLSDSRDAPQTYVSFRIVLYKDRFEYWEDGVLLKTVPTTGMENTTNFQLLIGGWDDTPMASNIYFDDISVEYEPSQGEPLKITILSPEERTYNTTVIDLNVTANKPVDEWLYSLNGDENVTFEPNTTIEAQEGKNSLIVYAVSGKELASAQVSFYVDTTPPGTVENLSHEVGTDYIYWSWDNPKDEDFSEALVYIDGKFQGRTTGTSWNLEGLSPGESHTIGILTEDRNGNINTTWVNDTATTLSVPVLTFADPTPGNGSLLNYSSITINVTSSENLSEAILEFDGSNYSMSGSGRSWWYSATVSDGEHTFRVYGTGPGETRGISEERTFEVDTKNPDYLLYGQTEDGMSPGGSIVLYARWSDAHLSYSQLWMNVTGSWEVFDEKVLSESPWSNFSVSLDEPGLYCWYIEAFDELEHSNRTPVECFRVYSPPRIVLYSPKSPVESYEGDVVSFSVEADQVVNVTWYVGESEVYREENVRNSTYTNSTARVGEYSVRALIANANGSDGHSWVWYVYPKPSLSLLFVPPTPEDGAMLNVRTIIINVTSSSELENATLEWNGANESMSGNGRNWWAVKRGLNDGTYTFRVYGSVEGVANSTEERTVEIDATPPEVIAAGQSAESVLEGDNVEVFAKWEDEHPSSAELWTNASEGLEWMRIPLELIDGWSNWTIETGEGFAGKTFCWYIRANDTFGNENRTALMCFKVEERLRIISFSPEAGNITVWDNGSVSFSIELNKEVNVTWFVNGSEVLRESGTTSTYTNTSLTPGLWNVTAEARHGDEKAEHSWILNVKTDTTPPALKFVPPTPENGSLTGDSEVTFNLTSNESLSTAVLYIDGEGHQMEGAGKEWSVTLSVDDGVHEFYGAGRDMHGNFNRTETRTFEVDTKAPLYVSYGQSSDSVLEGENIEVHVLWDEPHPETASLETNATENGEWRSVRMVEYSGWTNFTISTEGLSGLYCWRITARDSLEHENTTPEMCFRVRERLEMVSFSPENPEISSLDNESVLFSIELNQRANITWSINGSAVLSEEGQVSGYTNSSLIPGIWNVSVSAENENGYVHHWWILRVEKADRTPPALWFVKPTPENGTITNISDVVFNLTSNENLSMAVLEIDGANHTMSGSGRLWNLKLSLNDGTHCFRAYGTDEHGNTNSTGMVCFTLDTRPPRVWFIPPTPENGSILNFSSVTFSISSNEALGKAVLHIDNSTYSMQGGSITLNLSDGEHYFYVVASDRAGNSNRTEERLISVDTTPPDISLEAPEEAGIYTEVVVNITVTDQTADDGHPLRIRILQDGVEKAHSEIPTSPAKVSYSFTTENAGNVNITVIATDGLGWESRKTVIIWIFDNEPPALHFVKPTPENGSLAGNSLITFNLTSNENLSMAVLEIDGTNMSMMGSRRTWHLSLNLPDGRHGFRGYGKDLAGNMNSTGLRFFTVDSTPPEITVNAPSVVEMGASANVTITLDDAHPAGYRVLENGKLLLSGNYSRGERFVLNLNTEKTGLLNYTVEANDTAGHTSSISFTVEIVDTTPPSISFKPPTPEDGSLLNQSGITFKISSSENLSIALLELDGMNYSMEGEGTDWSIALALNDGMHTFRAYGADLHGNENSTEVRSFEVDTEKPGIEVTAPEEVERGSEANVSVVITDRHPANYTILLNGETVKTGNYSNAEAIVLSLNTGSVGNLSYSIFAVDRAGNLAEKDFTVEVVDTTPPTIQFIPPTPENASILNVSEVEFRINSSEELSKAVLLSNDSRFNGTVLEKANSQWSVSITLPDGSYAFQVEGWDVAGNPGFSEERSITVDTRAPSLSFVEPTPENGSLVGSCTMRITINASEELAEAILEFDGTSYTMSPSGGLWSYSGSLCSGDGLHSFRVYGRDLAGNWNSTEVRVIVVDSTPPKVIWVHPVNMTLAGENTYRAERLSRAWLLFNVSDAHPGSYSVFLNPKPHLIQSPIWSGEYSSGVPFGFLVKTKETGVNIYRISIRDAAGNSLSMDYAVNVSDTTPPGDVVNPVVRTDSSGFTLSWRNPYDDDFDHVELYLDPRITEGKKGEKIIDWADAFLANISGSPGHLMEYSKSTAHGNHVLYIRTVDSYGNRGNFTELSFNVPLPPFNLSYIKPTPENGSIVKPEKNEVTIKVQSSLALSSCVLTWNGEEMPMKVSGKTCSLSVPVIPGENYTFFVTAWDTYLRGQEMGRISFSVCGECFFKESSMEITSPAMDPMSLKFPVSFLFRTNTLARKYIYEVDVLGERITGEFNPTLNLLNVKELKGINVYTFNATFLLDLWGLRNKLVRVIKEGRPVEVGLHLAAIDACKKAIETERSFSVCGNAEEPKFWVELKNFYYGDEDVIIKAHYDNLTPVEAFYYSVNGGEWVKFNGTANLTGELVQGANKVKIKAITRCGLEGVKDYEVFIGPRRNGDWVVNNTQSCRGFDMDINGSLLITENGLLEMRKCRIHLTGGTEVNGTLRVLDNSLLDAQWMNGSGVLTVSASKLEGFSSGELEGSRVSIINSEMSGYYTFLSGNVSILRSVIRGDVTANGSLVVEDSSFFPENGLIFRGGVLKIEDSTFSDGTYGVYVDGQAEVTLRNLRAGHSSEAGILINGTGGTALLENITAWGNGIGLEIQGYSFRLVNSLLDSNEKCNLRIISPGSSVVENSSLKGSPTAVILSGYPATTPVMKDTNVSGSIETGEVLFKFIASPGSKAVLKSGQSYGMEAQAYGELTLQDYSLRGGSIKVYGTGSGLIVGDELLDTNLRVNENGQLVILNSAVKNSSLSLGSEKVLIRGSTIEGGSFTADRTYHYGLEPVAIVKRTLLNGTDEWFYSTDYPGKDWAYNNSTEGMESGEAPFVASFSKGRNDANTEVGQFTDLYLKKIITVDKLPNEAVLAYYAISGIEVYINGMKVLDRLNHRAQLTFSMGWGGGRITAAPLTGFTDVSGYLRTGKNVIAVHVKVPSDNSNYLSLGAFDASLYVWGGVLGITDSVVKIPVHASNTGLSLVKAEMHGNVSVYDGPARFVDSQISGSTRIRGTLYSQNTSFIGTGRGKGIETMLGAMITLNGSSVRGFGCGICSNTGSVEIYGTEVRNNSVGIKFSGAGLNVESSYITNNDVGIEAEKAFVLHNSVVYENGVGVLATSTGTIDHSTINGNLIGLKIAGGRVTNSLIQDNDLGILLNSSSSLTAENNSLMNTKDVHIISAGPVIFNMTDWGGYTPKKVTGYSGGVMYTRSGGADANYDILDERNSGSLTLGSVTSTGYGWGSSLLSVSLDVLPSNGSMVKGVVALHGTAVSRRPILRVNYTLIYNGTETLIGSSQPGESIYDDYIYFDTVLRKLSGSGALKFTAIDSDGRKMSAVRRVYFRNADIELINVETSHPTAIYTLSKVENANTPNSHMVIPYRERFANVTVTLKNFGALNGTVMLELVLPDYIERHTGRITVWLPIQANDTVRYSTAFPLTVYDWIKLRWDPQPEEFPMNKVIPLKVRLYGEGGELLGEEDSTISFDFGPVFRLESLRAYPFSEKYCNNHPDSCHRVNIAGIDYTYDGDGDENLEAAESYHFSLAFTNIGDSGTYIDGITIRETIPERDYFLLNGLGLKGHSTSIEPMSPALKDAPSATNMLGMIGPGDMRIGKDLWMSWWEGVPPFDMPPYNYTGYYTNYMLIVFKPVDAQGHVKNDTYYVAPAVNTKKVYVKALEKSFHTKTVSFDPILVTVNAVKDNNTYLTFRNTNDNVFYDYYAEGSFGPMEGYKWYHIIPPGFTFKAIAHHSKRGVHYRVEFNARPSLLGNELQVVAIGLNGVLSALGIKVPAETIAMGVIKAILKLINIFETTMEFQEASGNAEWNFTTIKNSPNAGDLNQTLMNSNATVIVRLSVDEMAKLEREQDMTPNYYEKLENIDELSGDEQFQVVKTLGKAMILDEDLRMLLIESVLEAADLDIFYDILKAVYAYYQGNTQEGLESSASSMQTLNMKMLEEIIKEVVKERLEKTQSYQSALEEGTENAEKMVDKASAGPVALVTTTISLGLLMYYVATAPVPEGGQIVVLDPPGNYTVEMEKADREIIFGGTGDKGVGWGNSTITFGKKDVYHAEYTAFTKSLSIGPLFEGMLERAEINIDSPGKLLMMLKPKPENATAVRMVFSNEMYAKMFAGAYLRNISSLNVSINGSWIILRANGTLRKLPEDDEVHIDMSIDEEYARANITRIGHYRGALEVKPMFGIASNNTKFSVHGNTTVLKGTANNTISIVVPKNESVEIKPPEINASPLELYSGGSIFINTTKPCAVSWTLGNKTGRGRFVGTAKLKPGKYLLAVRCLYGNLSSRRSFNITIEKRPVQRKKVDGALVNAVAGRAFRIRTKTDMYFLSFISGGNLTGVLAVYQKTGCVKAPEGYAYLTYALFNVTHPANWSITNVTIAFRVSKEWLGRNNVSPERVLLLHYENGWVEYKPTLDYEDAKYVHYTVKVPGLSLFAVAEKLKVEKPEEAGTETETPVEGPTGTPTNTPGGTESSPATGGNAEGVFYYALGILALLALAVYLYRRR
ncbi:hypothetical protein JCM16138_08800 [Thermococcus atlanticus]